MNLEIREAGPRDFRLVAVDEAARETDLLYSCPHRRAAQRKAERYGRSRSALAARLELVASKGVTVRPKGG